MSTSSFSFLNSSLDAEVFPCSNSKGSVLITAAFSVIRATFLLPLYTIVLYLGVQRWRQQRSFKTTSPSDIFVYHVAVVELIWILGWVLFLCGYSSSLREMMIVGYCLSFIPFYGDSFFHVLTCVERYLAVVHPVTYLGLKNVRGVRIRNVSIGCVWLMCFVWTGIKSVNYPTNYTIPIFGPLIFSFVVVTFCSISVLCVLIRPGPGEGGREKVQVDQSKQRAFITVMTIMAVLWLWFFGLLVSYALVASPLLTYSVGCVVKASTVWFNLPSSLVLPLLYLLRAGKLTCCCSNRE